MNHTFCQSCGMPIDDPALRGTERGGTPSEHYCQILLSGREPLPER